VLPPKNNFHRVCPFEIVFIILDSKLKWKRELNFRSFFGKVHENALPYLCIIDKIYKKASLCSPLFLYTGLLKIFYLIIAPNKAILKTYLIKEINMKKQRYSMIAFILLLSLVFSLAVSASAEEAVAGLANPLHEATADSLKETFGVTMTAPTFVNSVSWFSIDGNPGTAEMRFAIGSQNYTYRASKTGTFQDISGMNYTWKLTGSAVLPADSSLNGLNPTVNINEGEQGVLLWYDSASQMMYSLSMDSAASAQQLTTVAGRIYGSAKTEPATPATPVTSGTVTGTVTYATNENFGLNVGGQYYDFAITSATQVNTVYFDTGDVLSVDYSGDSTGKLTALVVNKISVIVTPAPQPKPTYVPAPTVDPGFIKPVQNPMITGEGTLTSWGSTCTFSNGLQLSIPGDISIPSGYFPTPGDYVGYTYNSALMELREIHCIKAAGSGSSGSTAPADVTMDIATVTAP